ncbi:hypothetical protein K402DRAFT_393514, partial [Aulographum hederae CBS 113979]
MSKEDLIASRQANLELPEQPPVASDWNSADASTVNVGSGEVAGDISHGAGTSSGLREPASGESAVRTDENEYKTHTAGADVGRQAKEGLCGLPNDAVTRDAKNKQGTVDTMGKDYGYPEKSDPSSGL